MDESGYCDQSSGIAEEVNVIVSSGLIECPLEKDGTLLLSTIQGQLPGAAGLSFSSGSMKRAIRYDSKTGKLTPPAGGWADRQYEVTFYTPPRTNCIGLNAFDKYDMATKSFQSSIQAVKEIMQNGAAATDIGYEGSEASEDKIVEKLKQQIYTLMSSNEKLTAADEKSTMDNQLLKQRIEELEQNNVNSHTEEYSQVVVNQTESACNNNYESREVYEEKIQTLCNQLDEKQRAEENISGELHAAKDRICDLERLAGLKDQEHWQSLQVAQEQLRHQDEELQRLRDQLSAAESLSHERVTHIHTLEGSMHTMNETEGQLRSEIDSQKTELAQLQEKLNAESGTEESRKKMNDLSQRKAELKAELNSVKCTLEEYKAQVDTINQENKTLKGLIEEKDANIAATTEQKSTLEWQLGEHTQWLADCKTRIQELEEILSGKDGEIQGMYDTVQGLQWEVDKARKDKDDAMWRIGEMETACGDKDAEVANLKREIGEISKRLRDVEGEHTKVERQASNHQLESVFEMSNELKSVHQRKYELESQVDKIQADLRESNKRREEMGGEVKRLQEEIWCSNERKAHLEHSEGCLIGERDDLARRLHEAENKSNWIEGELNAVRGHTGDSDRKCGELQAYRDKAARHLWDSFLVRKEPYFDRNKWILAMWNENKDEEYVRVWFEVDAPNSRHVYLMSSFFNWECALLCTMHDHGKWGVWVDVPRGRHEFRFLVDGHWVTTDAFPKVPNEFGSDNNWRVVE